MQRHQNIIRVFEGGWVDNEHTQVVHKGTDAQYSVFVVDHKHTNQGSQCSYVATYTLVVHNVALYCLGGAHDNKNVLQF